MALQHLFIRGWKQLSAYYVRNMVFYSFPILFMMVVSFYLGLIIFCYIDLT